MGLGAASIDLSLYTRVTAALSEAALASAGPLWASGSAASAQDAGREKTNLDGARLPAPACFAIGIDMAAISNLTPAAAMSARRGPDCVFSGKAKQPPTDRGGRQGWTSTFVDRRAEQEASAPPDCSSCNKGAAEGQRIQP